MESTGTIPALSATTSSSTISFSGTWPATTGTYYLLIVLSAADDGNPGNATTTGAVAVGVPDYEITSSSFPTGGSANDSYSGSFAITNSGADVGTQTITWTLYQSTDSVFNAGDTLVQSGTTTPLAAGTTSGTISYTGNWPSTTGVYYLIIIISAADDSNTTNNTSTSNGLGVTAPAVTDYTLIGATYPTSGAISTALSGSFSITNSGTVAGAQPITWTVYISTDTLFDAGDTLVQTGTTAALGAGGSTPITFSGTWPASGGSLYLIIVISATDDSDTTNNTDVSSAIPISIPDYAVTNVNLPTSGVLNGSYNGSFDITNIGSATGGQPINYVAYFSTDNTVGGGDTVLASGSLTPMGAGVTSATIPFSDTWPGSAGTYYFIITISAADDGSSSNNIVTSSGIPVTASSGADYTITSPSYPSTNLLTNYAFTGDFVITNSGTAAGAQLVSYNVYRSADTTLDAGDTSITSGVISPLGVSASSSTINFNGTWPSSAATYYLIITISASDDFDISNNTTNGAIVVSTSSRFITVGDAGTIGLSNDGNLWTQPTGTKPGGGSTNLNGVFYLNGLLIAVGAGGLLSTSSDGGNNWTDQTSGTTVALYGVAYGNGRFVAVGYGGTNNSTWTWSTDGITWTAGTALVTVFTATGIAFSPGAGRFVAVQGGWDYPTRWCTDGTDWSTNVPLPSGGRAYGITYGSSRFVAVGTTNSLENTFNTTDGSSWASIPPIGSTSYVIRAIAYNGTDRLVAVGSSGRTFYGINDGVNVGDWQLVTAGTGVVNLFGVAYGGSNRWVIVGGAGTIRYSTDNGLNYTPATTPPSGGNTLRSVTYMP